MNFTYDNTEDINVLRELLSKDIGIPVKYKVPYIKGSFYIMINNKPVNLYQITLKGGIVKLAEKNPFLSHQEIIQTKLYDINEFDDKDKFHYCYKTINDFGIDLKLYPKAYKDCGTNGWYIMQDVYEYKNKFYTSYDCD